jgi:phosphatidate cytidylyltransferase
MLIKFSQPFLLQAAIPAPVSDALKSAGNGIIDRVPLLDFPTMVLLGVVLALLAVAYAIGQYLQRQPESVITPAVVKSFNRRVQAWWMLYALLGLTLWLSILWPSVGRMPATIFFFWISFWALREFITLTLTRLGDHRVLFWVFFVFAPLQYILVALGDREFPFLGATLSTKRLFANLIPVYAFLFIPAGAALAGDHKRFLERTAKIQTALMICVFALSHAPALLDLKLTGNDGVPWKQGNAGVLLFFILVVQMSDVFQFIWNHTTGKRKIAPAINETRTWEGLTGGVLSAMVLGVAISWVTPFNPLQAALMSALLGVMGFAGSMTMSAIKRDRGVQDYGTLVEGHVGVLDRFDSICFAAPVFYHITNFLFT